MRMSGALTAALGVLGVFTAVAMARLTTPARVPIDELAIALPVTTYAAVGVLIEAARPGHRVGRLMVLGAALWGVGEGALAIGLARVPTGDGSGAAAAESVLGTAARAAGWLVLVLAVPLVFPDGRLPWPGRRWPAGLALAGMLTFVSAVVLAPMPLERRLESLRNPMGLPPGWQVVADLLALGGLSLCGAVLIVAIVGLLRRWRIGDELSRQRLTWLILAFVVPLAFLPVLPSGLARPWMFAAITIPVPLAIGVAILQRRLYNLQAGLAKALTFALLSAAIAAVYAATVGAVAWAFNARGAVWLPWVAAGVVAVSVAPLRGALRAAAIRVTYGRWAQPGSALSRSAQRLVDASDVPGILDELVAEVAAGLELEQVRIADGEGRTIAGHGAATDAGEAIPLISFGIPVGELRWTGRALGPRERRLLEDLGAEIAPAVHAAGLLTRLRRAQHQLVLAREDERRRLRRDIHDGLGPELAALSLRVDTIRNLAARGEGDLDSELLHLRAAIHATVVNVRRIVEGLRPPALDDLGLGAALEHLLSQASEAGLTWRVDVNPPPPLPAAVEVATFRVAQEAVTNVLRHADASHIALGLHVFDGTVELTVSDDGTGAAAAGTGGLGLISMRERAEELGGTVTVTTGPGAGTIVTLRLPLHPENRAEEHT